MSDIKINGQPVGRMVYNADNFKRLQSEVLECYELITKLNARLAIESNGSTQSGTKPSQESKSRRKGSTS